MATIYSNNGCAARMRAGAAALVLAAGLIAAPVQAQDAGDYLQQMADLSEEALTASREAQSASSVAAVKAGTEDVFEAMWGLSPDIDVDDPFGDVPVHGWKVRWQVSGSEYDPAFVERYGSEPPAITDPALLGIEGRGRHLRRQLDAIAADESASDEDRDEANRIIASLNNVIGWMRMDDGVTKGELQPRVDLTRQWDAPSEFWLSTSDTGWLFEAYTQAANILKTDYEGDLDMAQSHAAALTRLIEKYLNGVDADGDGVVEPVQMEGGLYTALREAESAGLVSR